MKKFILASFISLIGISSIFAAKKVWPVVDGNEYFLGESRAGTTIVAYLDMQCPFSKRSLGIMDDVLKKYHGRVRLVVKHLPLDFHKEARLASYYFESLRKQGIETGEVFFTEVFKRQGELKKGESVLKDIAYRAGADMEQLARDLKSKKVKDYVEKNIAEAKKLEISGTPTFVLNGTKIAGAYPAEHFYKIIDGIE